MPNCVEMIGAYCTSEFLWNVGDEGRSYRNTFFVGLVGKVGQKSDQPPPNQKAHSYRQYGSFVFCRCDVTQKLLRQSYCTVVKCLHRLLFPKQR